MLSALRPFRSPSCKYVLSQFRTAATQSQKRAGDISDAFVSLSGQQFGPLAPEYADLKSRLIGGREQEIRHSWERLLQNLREEIPLIVEKGSKIIPEIDFKDIDNAPETFNNVLRSRGVAVVRGVIPESEALQWKEDLREHIRQNPQTKGVFLPKQWAFEVKLTRKQHSLQTTLKSSNCTGRAPNSALAAIPTSQKPTASSFPSGTPPIRKPLSQHATLSATPTGSVCDSPEMLNSLSVHM
jgi:hypothetical protein